MDVWMTASELARGYLHHYGNVLNRDHWQAIQSLVDVFTAICFGGVLGRLGVGMPTGSGKTMSAVAFLVPGALGIQEGGFLLVGAAFGISAPLALALAAARRLRDLVVFLPGLLAWQWAERSRPAASH